MKCKRCEKNYKTINMETKLCGICDIVGYNVFYSRLLAKQKK